MRTTSTALIAAAALSSMGFGPCSREPDGPEGPEAEIRWEFHSRPFDQGFERLCTPAATVTLELVRGELPPQRWSVPCEPRRTVIKMRDHVPGAWTVNAALETRERQENGTFEARSLAAMEG